MIEQEAFEKYWYIETLTQSLPNGAEDVAKKAWQAATAEANKRIAALEGEVANLHLNIKAQEELGYELQAKNTQLEGEVAELSAELGKLTARYGIEYAKFQANNHDLREALEEIANRTESLGIESIAQKAIATTPAESLQAHDDEVIEKCAKICDENGGHTNGIAENLAFKIRALKEVK